MIDYQQILENLGYKLKDCGNFWQAAAIYREGDNPTALQIYKDSGAWKDHVEDTPFQHFDQLIRLTCGSNDNGLIQSILNGSKNSEPRAPKKQLLREEKAYPASCLSRLLPHYDFYSESPRSISIPTLKDYQCGLATSGKMYKRMVFPIFRSDGKVHGFSGRKVIEKDDRPKWLHNGKSSEFFYPYFTTPQTKESIRDQKRVFIVESVGDSVSLYDKGVPENLVSFGLSLSPKFVVRLSSLPVEKIVLAFNNDYDKPKNRGLFGAVKAILKLSETIDFQKLYLCLPQKNDFGVMNKEDVENYVRNFQQLSHKDSMLRVLEEALDIEKKLDRPNKAFSDSLKKFKKKYDFHYD